MSKDRGKNKRALITGVTGQDGSYLAEFLLSKGYEVHGIIRRASTFNTKRIDHIIADHHDPDTRFYFYYGDLSDSEQISNILTEVEPSEIYHLGAQSHVRVSFDIPEFTGNVTGLSTTRLLEAIKRSRLPIKLYQASSSEMFGSSPPPQNEETLLKPRSPYACAKVYAHLMTNNYREGYGIWVCNGILFNHESPRRGETFVTRKITRAVASILANKQRKLYIGNLDNSRDWGYSPEYVEVMWKMLQMDKPDDFVIGTGEAHSIREFVEEAFSYVNLNWEKYIVIDPMYFRPTEPETLIADEAKAKELLGWSPKIKFKDLVKIMVDADMRSIGLKPIGEGDKIIKSVFPNRWWQTD
ncbi:MAG: GDP-mannose 4,6-dehydratase [Nitrososphaerota archaeon]|nr:GDP-mannose 4,6-dehydratase [Nitrososphaerota archaeon]